MGELLQSKKKSSSYKYIIGIVAIIVGLQLVNPFKAQAGPLEEYQGARNTYLFAMVCQAAYGDRIAQIATTALLDHGWQIQHYFETGDVEEARFFLAKNENYDGIDAAYLLAVSGTENGKDIQVDLDYGKVYFAGSTIEEIQKNATIKSLPPGVPLVHHGFLKYVNTILATKDGEKKLVDQLLEDHNKKIYMVGHSLGGAVVTMTAAYLINIGVSPEQIKVVTFGAPAVGNEIFAGQIGAKINLNRIVNHGDPVPSVLKDFVGGYRQFGENTVWQVPDDSMRFPHEMAVYLDTAMKKYYDKLETVRELGITPAAAPKKTIEKQEFYIAPIIDSMPDELHGEFSYMRESLLDQYQTYLSVYGINADDSHKDENLATALQKASAAGCKWVLSARIEGDKVKNEQGLYYLTVEQTIYQVSDGRPVTIFSFSTNTKNFTPLEGVLSDSMQVSQGIATWLKTEKN